nr:lysosome-associated membrane glycoprotein 3 [Nothobranchius furzeri]
MSFLLHFCDTFELFSPQLLHFLSRGAEHLLFSLIMKQKHRAWSVFFLTALIPGFHLHRDDISSQEAQIFSPVLQPNETIPTPGTYTLKDPDGRTCIKATMGAEYIVTEMKSSWYFNLDPSRIRMNGYCGKEDALLSLTLPNDSAGLHFTFRTERNIFYVTNLTAHLFPQPVCKSCLNKSYSGSVAHEKLFKTLDGHSFKCKSATLLLVSSKLKIKLDSLQMQAFGVPNGLYGEEDECWADFNKRTVPIIIGSIIVSLILCIMLSFLFIRDHRRPGYERL